MKKLLITTFLVSITVALQAQTVSGVSSVPLSKADKKTGVRIGIRAGLSFATLSCPSYDFDSRTTFHAGITFNIPIVNFGNPSFKQGIDVITGLSVCGKGMEYKQEDSGTNVKETVSPLYLQLPMLVSYRFKPCKVMQLQFDFGLYFAYGISGKYKIEHRNDKTNESVETDFFGDDNTFQRADWGLHMGFGATFVRHFHFGVAYETGFWNIKHKNLDTGSGSWKHNVWSVSLGYDF